MLARLQKAQKKDSGFTLIELLVVIVIIGILAGIAIPLFLNQRQKAADASVKSDLRNAATVMETEYVEDQTYANVVEGDFNTSNLVALDIVSQTVDAYCIEGTHPNGDVEVFSYSSATGDIAEAGC